MNSIYRLGTLLSAVFLVLALSACGYRLQGATSSDSIALVEIPYIAGDTHGVFTGEMIRALSRSGDFRYTSSQGDLILYVAISGRSDGAIGWKYNRLYPNVFEKRLMPIENRLSITATFSLVDNQTGRELIPPTSINAFEDYDYANTSAYADEIVATPNGNESVINYSLGQLDAPDGASLAASDPVYRKIAEKIMTALINKKYPD